MIRKNEHGVSAVVGAILMVAVTVTIAALVYTNVSNIMATFAPERCQIAEIVCSETTDKLQFRHLGGEPLTNWSIAVNGAKKMNGTGLNIGGIITFNKSWAGRATVTLSSENCLLFCGEFASTYNIAPIASDFLQLMANGQTKFFTGSQIGIDPDAGPGALTVTAVSYVSGDVNVLATVESGQLKIVTTAGYNGLDSVWLFTISDSNKSDTGLVTVS